MSARADVHRDNTAKLVRAPNITIQVINRSIGIFDRFRFIRFNESDFTIRIHVSMVTWS